MLKDTPKKFPPKQIYNAFETMAGSAIYLAEYIFACNCPITKLPPEVLHHMCLAMYYLGVILHKEDFEPVQTDLTNLTKGERRATLKQAIIDLAEELKKEL